MSPAALLPLVLFVLVATVTPGAATTLATASGAHFGYRRTVPFMAGAAMGLALMAASTGAGLSQVVLGRPDLQLAMKGVGSAYLLWLAWKIGRAGPPRLQAGPARPPGFPGGVWLLWQNPKGWAMTLGAAASFTALAAGPLQLGVLLGCVFGIGAGLSLSLWCAAGSLLARLLRGDGQWRALNSVLGLLLVASILPMWLM